MDYCDMYDHFLPLTDTSHVGSSYDNLHDHEFGNSRQQKSYEYERNKSLSAVKYKVPLSKRLENGETALTMQMRRSDRPKKEAVKLPEKYEDIVAPSPAVPSDCCHHQREPGIRRKFVISFGANNASATNDCLISERNRCQDFWKFIDSHPNLLELMREGEFVHSNPPHLAITPSIQRRLSTKQNGEILRAKHKELHEAENQRKLKRKIIFDELQKKSGQPVFVRKPGMTTKTKPRKTKGCSELDESFKEMMREMNIYDKVCGSPDLVEDSTNRRLTSEKIKERLSKNTPMANDEETKS